MEKRRTEEYRRGGGGRRGEEEEEGLGRRRRRRRRRDISNSCDSGEGGGCGSAAPRTRFKFKGVAADHPTSSIIDFFF